MSSTVLEKRSVLAEEAEAFVLPEPAKAKEPADFLSGLTEPGVRDVRDRLLRHGASRDMTTAVVRAVLRREARGAWAIDAAADILGRALPILPSPKLKREATQPHVIAFVGPTGAGKTTTLAKLGRRLEGAGRRVLYASLDAVGAGELERLSRVDADVDRTEVPIVALRSASDLAALVDEESPDIVLVDTPGLSPRDTDGLAELEHELRELPEIGTVDVFLALSATTSRAAVRLARSAFVRIGPTACVLTKLDETDEPAAILEEVGRDSLAIAFLCDGADVLGNLVRPTSDRLADLVLVGRYRS